MLSFYELGNPNAVKCLQKQGKWPMEKIGALFVLWLIATVAMAQSDLCWRDPYPLIPGEWAGSGSVIEAGNRFQRAAGATVWSYGQPRISMTRPPICHSSSNSSCQAG